MLDFARIRGVIADMDGVLWRGDMILPGASEIFRYLHSRHIPYVFATNNSSRAVAYYVEKLSSLNIPVRPDQIVTSASATAAYLFHHYTPQAKIFVVGETGLKTTLQAYGFTLVNGGIQPDFVVSGIDRQFNYQKLKQAADYIRSGAIYIATNSDKTLPVPDGFIPGAGSILAAIETASGKTPVIIGKPESPMFEIALQQLGTSPEETLMIGDRLETDIVGAGRLSIQTALMLSGVSTEITDDIQPDAVYDHLAALLNNWRYAA